MGVTRIAALVTLTGIALMTAGCALLFGAWALVAAGAVIVLLGLVVDWEKAT